MNHASVRRARIGLLLTMSLQALSAFAGEIQVAVAASVYAPMQRIAADFERDSGHQARLTPGSTGKFYAQILRGAPFDLLLAADDKTPRLLVEQGQAVAASRTTYAIGRLVLWSRKPEAFSEQGETLLRGHRFKRLAIADPKLAPYGAAAMEVLHKLGLHEVLAPRLVTAENAAQAYQYVATGNADVGLIALSQVSVDGRIGSGSGWIVPAALHAPLKQDLVILHRARHHAPAKALAAYLVSDKARTILRSYGYQFTEP